LRGIYVGQAAKEVLVSIKEGGASEGKEGVLCKQPTSTLALIHKYTQIHMRYQNATNYKRASSVHQNTPEHFNRTLQDTPEIFRALQNNSPEHFRTPHQNTPENTRTHQNTPEHFCVPAA
jgi:hypothetical protein